MVAVVNRASSLFFLVFVIIAACVVEPSSTSTTTIEIVHSVPSATPPPSATPVASITPIAKMDEGHPGKPLPQELNTFFSTSGSCAICHSDMIDDTGIDVSIDSEWRSTMMANSARDPYWQASVEGEVRAYPERQSEIEDLCATCHMPMARFTAVAQEDEAKILGETGFINPESELHAMAMDGVSCSLCHQIRENGLGVSTSYSGNFFIDSGLRSPDRVIFGPYTIDGDQASIMQSASGFRPEQGLHLTGSGLCATCHTLYTPYVDATGKIVGEFPEQVPYLEWFYSDYRRTSSCQDCHMPEAQGGVKISNTSQVLRSPFARHTFVGGNVYMLEILRTYSEELGVSASSVNFERTIDRTYEQLQTLTASIALDNARLSGARLYADVAIENLAGHKFPTGFPSRRAWIHFIVLDATGQVVFESGAFDPDGSIIGNDNDEDPGMYEQHYLAIVQPTQVQIYEAILGDTQNRVTTTLIEAAKYRKDNRLLPSGFEKEAPYEDIAVRGGAREDADFQGGGDEIQYLADVGNAEGPFVVTVELLYQSIGYRWVDNLRRYDGPAIERFLGYSEGVPNLPIVVASATIEVDG